MLGQPKNVVAIAGHILPASIPAGVQEPKQLVPQVFTELPIGHETALFEQLVAGGIVRELAEIATALAQPGGLVP
jgi:hypothetical protein